MRIILTQLLFALIITANVFGQTLDTRTQNQVKAKFLFANELFEQKKYNDVFEKVEEIEAILNGVQLASLLDLKVKTLISLGRYQEAKDALFILEGLELSEDIIKNLGEYSEKIENGVEKEKLLLAQKLEKEKAKIQAAKELEAKRKEEEREKIKAANAIYPTLVKQLEEYKKLMEGRPYYSKLRDKLTVSAQEKAYIVFLGDKYIVYTIPSASAFDELSDENIRFSSFDASRFEDKVTAKVPSGKSKYEKYFKKSIINDNASVGGYDEDILWNQYYSSVDQPLYYYCYYNTLHCDISLKKSFQETYFNPYIETGTVVKTVDFNLVVDSTLTVQLKNAGFKHKVSTNVNSPEGLKVTLVSSGNINMLYPMKKVHYKYNSVVNGSSQYPNGGSKYKGEYYYYESGEKSLHIGYTEFSSQKISKNIYSVVGEPANNYIFSKSNFDLFYISFEKTLGSGKESYFTKPSYRLPFDAGKYFFLSNIKEYHENGNLASSGVMMNGKKYGLWEFYSENGSLERKVYYYDFKGDFPEYVYSYKNDVLISIERYDHYGKQNSTQYYFQPEKSILQVAYFKDDVIRTDGIYKASNCDPDDFDGIGEIIEYRSYDESGILKEDK